jgi:hypothetical protein
MRDGWMIRHGTFLITKICGYIHTEQFWLLLESQTLYKIDAILLYKVF